MKKSLVFTVLAACLAFGMRCFAAYPAASSAVALNQWSTDYNGTLNAAGKSGHPILFVMVNTEGFCGHCDVFMQLTVNGSEFPKLKQELPFYLVLVQPNNPAFETCLNRYRPALDSGMYPICAVLNPDGSMYSHYGNRTTDKMDVTPQLRQDLRTLAGANTGTKLALTAVDTPMLLAGETFIGAVLRTAGEGSSGTVRLSLSGDNAGSYAVEPNVLEFSSTDDALGFTVRGPAEVQTLDLLKLTISAEGFDGKSACDPSTLQLVFAGKNAALVPIFNRPIASEIGGYVKVNAAYDFSASCAMPITYSATGLPKGLSIDQATGIVTGTVKKEGTYHCQVIAATEYGQQVASFDLTFAKLGASVKGKYSGILFDAGERVVGSATYAISGASVNVQVVQGGRKTKVKCGISSTIDGHLYLVDAKGGVFCETSSDVPAGVMCGNWNGLKVVAVKNGAACPCAGSYNAALRDVNGALAGYVSAKIGNNGKISVKAKAGASRQISANGPFVMIPQSVIAAKLPTWDSSSDAGFFMVEKGSDAFGGEVLAGGLVFGDARVSGAQYAMRGAPWPAGADLSAWAGCSVRMAGLVSPALTLERGSKLTLDPGTAKWKFSVTGKTGLFKGSCVADGVSYKFTGALVLEGGSAFGVGTAAGSGRTQIIEIR